jgi:hypothetical protein
MNITCPLMAGVVRAAEMPGNSVASLLRTIGAGTGWFDDSAPPMYSGRGIWPTASCRPRVTP